MDASKLLTVLETQIRPGDALYEIGGISPQVSTPLQHTFVLRNNTSTPLTLDRLQPSCSCTTASIVGEAAGSAPIVIAPNQTLSVQVSVDPQLLSPGLQHKSVWVFVRDQDAPAATLEMAGAILPAVSFSPPSLSFGRIEKGTELTLLLKVSPRSERLEQGTELRLVSPDPDVQVTEVPQDAPVAGALPEDAPAARSFRVRLVPHAHVGRLQGKLSLVLAHLGDPAGTMGPVVDMVAWRADVAGDITASLPIVAFGTVGTGQGGARRLLLTGSGVSRLKVSSDSAYLSATLKATPGRTEGVQMDVRLDPQTPPGSLDTRLRVTNESGEQLVLPVFALVGP